MREIEWEPGERKGCQIAASPNAAIYAGACTLDVGPRPEMAASLFQMLCQRPSPYLAGHGFQAAEVGADKY
ncbi:hypothetical protein GCM10011378_08720 [Hymenobacter glacieicola]|uniref:Uncharacterized protein n=1 Tax=Hymenobacter glacieicola TaxID=1562124 RepID=A0ABQ1WKI7_9BACT|nr:hypothetical protein GCM10011378_08720 [Hymenobacter glacieicola]